MNLITMPFLTKNALFLYEPTEEQAWVRDASRLVGDLSFYPYAIRVSLVTNYEFNPEHLFDTDMVILPNIHKSEPNSVALLAEVKKSRPDMRVVFIGPRSIFFQLPHAVNAFLRIPFTWEEISDALYETLFLEPARAGRDGFDIVHIEPISLEIIDHLARHSEDLYRVSGRFFEKLLAQLLHERGWEVELTPIVADGGIDIVAIRKGGDIAQMMLVQAKRYARYRKVGIAAVRELLHVVDDKKATAGMLVTTSGFTKPALSKQRVYKWRLSLKAHNDVVKWLQEYSEAKLTRRR